MRICWNGDVDVHGMNIPKWYNTISDKVMNGIYKSVEWCEPYSRNFSAGKFRPECPKSTYFAYPPVQHACRSHNLKGLKRRAQWLYSYEYIEGYPMERGYSRNHFIPDHRRIQYLILVKLMSSHALNRARPEIWYMGFHIWKNLSKLTALDLIWLILRTRTGLIKQSAFVTANTK